MPQDPTIADRLPIGGPIALEHLIALNDEIAALARAGMPLERGLLGVGTDVRGRLGAIATRLGERIGRGQSLPEALEAEGTNLPPTYRAVVEAGIRSGRLASALEGLAGFARGYLELRRAVGLAMLYPVLVLLIGYAMFVGMILLVIPRLLDAFAMLRMPMIAPIRWLGHLGDWAWIWGPILPGVVAFGVMAWVASGRARAIGGRGGRALRWIPGMRAILDGAVAAQFAEWLAMLVEHGVPWADAVELAADASGDPKLKAAARGLAESSRRGEPIGQGMRQAPSIPPLLRWLMTAGRDQGSLVPALRHAADTYRRRTLRRAATLRATLPTVMILGIGASATVVYTMTLFVPWTTLLYNLSK